MTASDPQLAALARLVADTAPAEIDCEAFLGRVAAYLDAATDHTRVASDLGPVTQHLRVCSECREEFAALLRACGIDPASVPGA